MPTNIDVTYSALNSWYLDTSTMTINADSLCEHIIEEYYKQDKFKKELVSGKCKVKNIVWEIFTHLSNLRIGQNEYPYHQNYYASNYQLKKWLDEYGDEYVLDGANETLEIMRQCYQIAMTGGYREKEIVKDGDFVIRKFETTEEYNVYGVMNVTSGNMCLVDIDRKEIRG